MTIWTAMQTEVFRTVAVLIVLSVLCGIAISALVIIARHTRSSAVDARKMHLQQANIISMLLRAGFRPAKAKPDWHDSGHETQVMGACSPYDTHVDPFAAWRAKQD